MHFFMDKENGSFEWKNADRKKYLYLPLTNESGIMNCITPDGHGDSKLSQNAFLMEPVSIEDLHESMRNRNIWCKVEGQLPWSAWGTSACQQGKLYTEEAEEMNLEIGRLWQKVTRVQKETGLSVQVLNFCPPTDEPVEIMKISMKNTGKLPLMVQMVAALPIYGRSADNLRDHRHVTSLLNRIKTTEYGVEVSPTLSFDERGHQINHRIYGIYGSGNEGESPEGFYPVLQDFVGEGGSLYWPEAILTEEVALQKAGQESEGYEALGGIQFEKKELGPLETLNYQIVIAYDRQGMQYLKKEKTDSAFLKLEKWWNEQTPVHCRTKQQTFDNLMEWVGIQPLLRRIYGCSFLPHHDYGRGGRGWRDLWQDCLALILKNPEDIRQNLIDFYSGVRIDGSNATIIGAAAGEFKADRNAIVRTWMDHGYWPVLTLDFYLQQTGDYRLLLEKAPYFYDRDRESTWLKTVQGERYEGTIIEHMLVQNITQFFDTGAHNNMRLQGADWNDALDMAKENGESVAFTAAYSGNYTRIVNMLRVLKKEGVTALELSGNLAGLMRRDRAGYEDTKKKQQYLTEYCELSMEQDAKKESMDIEECCGILENMAAWIHCHIREQELIEGYDGELWFNGYYDNKGQQTECAAAKEEDVRMMLTGQVFAILSGTAADDQIEWIVKAVDHYLFDQSVGGYRLNTDFHELKFDLGRAFGFAYGHKENGAVFCHMAVMYAYALYSRGFAREGYRVLKSLEKQVMDEERSVMYPGIPEYFNDRGRGMYAYLTGAGSWMVLTVTTQMFGVRGEQGDLLLAPQLMKEQFDEEGNAQIKLRFADRNLLICYQNNTHHDLGDYEVEEISIDGARISIGENIIARAELLKLEKTREHIIKVIL